MIIFCLSTISLKGATRFVMKLANMIINYTMVYIVFLDFRRRTALKYVFMVTATRLSFP